MKYKKPPPSEQEQEQG